MINKNKFTWISKVNISQEHLNSVEAKLIKQNAVVAAIGVSFWAIPILTIWYFSFMQNPKFAPVMLVLTGALVGLVVRIHGRGYTRVFTAVTCLAYTGIALVAWDLGIMFDGTILAVILLLLFAAGMYLAMRIATIEVPFEEHRAYSYLTFTEPHNCLNKIKNRWFIVLPLLAICLIITSSITSLGVIGHYGYLLEQEHVQVEENRKQRIKNKEIDILPQALDKRSSHEILLYSYGYYTGLKFDKRGRRSEVFPQSKFKGLALLKYLVKYRDDARAKFILGFLSGGDAGLSLIKEAEHQNDSYARIYSTVSFGCHANEDAVRELLNKLYNATSEEHIKERISSILYFGIADACQELEFPEFSLSYVLNY